jgi:hypothetical protein
MVELIIEASFTPLIDSFCDYYQVLPHNVTMPDVSSSNWVSQQNQIVPRQNGAFR